MRIEPDAGDAYDLSYDILVVAMGSIARTLPIPGLADVPSHLTGATVNNVLTRNN